MEPVSVHDQAGRSVPNANVTWTLDASLTPGLTVAANPSGGWTFNGVTMCTGNAVCSVTIGSQTKSRPLPVVVTQVLTGITFQTP